MNKVGLCACGIAVAALAVVANRAEEADRTAGVDVEVFGPFVPTLVNVDLRQLPIAPLWHPGDPIKEIPRRDNRHGGEEIAAPVEDPKHLDPLVERQWAAAGKSTRAFGTPLLNIPGQGFTGVNPPDPSGEVGKDHYIQVINSGSGAVFRIHDKTTGAVLSGPTAMDSLGIGSCASGLGDGVVLYDALADRWLLTEFSSAGNRVCMYVSQTSNPIVGGWFAYQIAAPSFPDYPKYGVWPDAYYVSSNESQTAAYAIDRTAMLAGAAATVQRFTAPALSGFGFQALNPTDHDGSTLPPAGTQNYFMRHRDTEVHGPTGNPAQDLLEMWAFHVDFAVPANSSFSQLPSIAIAEIDSNLCGLTSAECFPQPGTITQLDPLREVLMFPIGYRNFGTHQSIVGNLVTDVATNRGGIRWFELRRVGAGAWSLFQQGTYAGDAPNGESRFMGSIKQDGDGNMALGYSVTSGTTFPSIRYTGRLVGDATGTMRPETSLVAGTASNSSNRWGDYSQMSVDPVDDCTFWYTMQYNTSSSWTTRIGSFMFDECGKPGFTLSGTNLDQAICSPASLADIALTIGQVQGFTNPVTLSFVGLPDGFSGDFTANPVSPPGNSTVQASVNASVLFGSYSFAILGTAADTDPRQVTVDVDVYDSAPLAPTLLTPANGQANVTSPHFTWNASAQATGHFIEVATDAGFTNIVDSANVGAASYASVGLAPDTDHFWRVTPSGPCGTGTTSATFSFQTSLTICRTPGLAINDHSTTSDTLSIATLGSLDDLNVSVDITHTFMGDLNFDLLHLATGTSVRLFNRSCGTGNNVDITFDDEAATAASANCGAGTPAIPPGSYRPAQVLSSFDGESFAGGWRLSVTDSATEDTGSLNEWCLTPSLSGICGDDVVDAGEQCDDGNTTNGDGCDANCKQEICGNGIVQSGEQCDDGNTTNGDGCAANCVVEYCGDGTVQAGLGEQCDDGNVTNGDNCDANCKQEICGNGIVQAGEACDDGNANNNDACANDCTIPPVTNLLVNGDFAAGNAKWTHYTNGSGAFTVASGEARVTFNSNASNVQLYQRNIAAASNTEHTVTFRARHTVAGQRITVRFARHTSPFTFYGLAQQVLLTTTMQPYTLSFRTTGDAITDGRLMFLLSDSDPVGSSIFFDDVSLAPATLNPCGNGTLDVGETCDGANLDSETCATQGFDAGTLACNAMCSAFVTTGCSTCGDGTVGSGEQCDDGNTASGDGCSSTCQTEASGVNLVTNGEFSGGTAGWSYSTNASSSFSVVGGEAFIDVVTAGTTVQLYQAGITLQPSTTYRLTFRGRNTGGRDVKARIIRHTSPYTEYKGFVANLTAAMQTFTTVFTTPGGTIPEVRLQMWIGPYDAAGADYFFDSFVLEQQ